MTLPGAVEDSLSATLDQAVRRVAANWAAVREDAASPEEVAALAAALGRVIAARVSAGAEGAGETSTPSNTPLVRRLLTLLRTEFMALASEPPPESGPLLRYLRAIESVAAELEPSWDQRFTDRLSGPDGPVLG